MISGGIRPRTINISNDMRRSVLHILALALLGLGQASSAPVVSATTSTGNVISEYPPMPFSKALAAYSLRQLNAAYGGPVIQVRRASDGAHMDFGFGDGGYLDATAVEAWLGTSDGHVAKWYSQIPGEPALVQSDGLRQPIIALGGDVVRSEDGSVAISFKRSEQGDYMELGAAGAKSVALNNYTLVVLVHQGSGSGEMSFAGINNRGRYHEGAAFRGGQSYVNSSSVRLGGTAMSFRSIFSLRNNGRIADLWQGNTRKSFIESSEYPAIGEARTANYVQVGGFVGTLSEVLVFPALSDAELLGTYVSLAGAWNAGTTTWNEGAILPQLLDYQVELYNWLKSITVADVTLEWGQQFFWDGSYENLDELADLWLQLEGVTASSVTRGEPEWYVLDAGNGKGIEATGTVRVWHEPKGGSYGGNPPRSWSNEPAYLYQLSIPGPGGVQANPFYKDPAMGRRAMVVAIVDMMMYHEALLSGQAYATWQDMYGKAMLGWAEAYRWTKEVLDDKTQRAFEIGLGHFLDKMISVGPRAVNTNMDMFAVQAAAEIYMAVDDPGIRSKTLQAVKRTLFGYPDGELEVRHRVFQAGSHEGGVFDPSGFIMEGDQPEIFYGGESIYHLMGAVAAVSDRTTGQIVPEWAFLEEVTRRVQEWRTYQYFYDPGVASKNNGGTREGTVYSGGAGFSGRTGAAVPSGQSDEEWKWIALADRFEDARHLIRKGSRDESRLPSLSDMRKDIVASLDEVNEEFLAPYVGTPPEWSGWSPWTKKTPYLPTTGWYTRLSQLVADDDASTRAPVRRRGNYYSKAFGGHPVGDQYWAYKTSDGAREWGFFLEAQGRQGGYSGWFGGKIETFWTESTGIVIMNRHGKGGCDGDKEDSSCWDNLDYRAGHHVWGLDENGRGFTTLLLRGRQLQREATFDIDSSTPAVTITNVFNDPSHASNPTQSETGEETGHELTGVFQVKNSFEALRDGIRVTHELATDESDELRELWASLPVFLRHFQFQNHPGDKVQADLEDTSIEYWDGSTWVGLPEDSNGDGVPELVSTTALRLGRDYLLGDGPQYVYVKMEGVQRVRLSTQAYEDPYQTMARVRTVHIDLHGSPGTVRTMPATKSLTYTIQTTDPTIDGGGDNGGGSTTLRQEITLTPGWNLVSRYVTPSSLTFAELVAAQCASVEMVKNGSGQVFAPKIGLNNLGVWEATEAYKVHVTESCTIVLEGPAVNPGNVSLTAGWNLVPYPFADERPITEAFASISGDLSQVRDGQGNVYTPGSGNNSIGTLKPGQGYEVFVQKNVNLTY